MWETPLSLWLLHKQIIMHCHSQLYSLECKYWFMNNFSVFIIFSSSSSDGTTETHTISNVENNSNSDIGTMKRRESVIGNYATMLTTAFVISAMIHEYSVLSTKVRCTMQKWMMQYLNSDISQNDAHCMSVSVDKHKWMNFEIVTWSMKMDINSQSTEA